MSMDWTTPPAAAAAHFAARLAVETADGVARSPADPLTAPAGISCGC